MINTPSRSIQRWVLCGIAIVALSTLGVAQADVIPVTSWADDVASGNGTNSPAIGTGAGQFGNSRIAGSFDVQTLGNVGDSISLTGSVTLSGVAGTANPTGSFRWGLLNVNGSINNAGWQGYLAESDASNTVGGPSLWRKTNAGSNYTSPGGSDINLYDVNQVAEVFASDLAYAIELKATLLAGNQLQIDFSLDNTLAGGTYAFAASLIDPTPSALSFDRVGFFVANNQVKATMASFSDINITVASVPEPGSISLMLLGLVGLLALKKYRS